VFCPLKSLLAKNIEFEKPTPQEHETKEKLKILD